MIEFISSDTNVWLDFGTIDRLDLPFRLSYVYLMNEESIRSELLNPEWLAEELLRLGLRETELNEEEFFVADELNQKYKKISTFDAIALAIAKCRGITLLTGDAALRQAAEKEGVPVLGTIGLLDQLWESSLIDTKEYQFCLQELEKNNGGKVRLPSSAIQERLKKIKL